MLFTFIPNFGQIESVYGSNMGVLSPLFTFYGHFSGYLWTTLLEQYPALCITSKNVSTEEGEEEVLLRRVNAGVAGRKKKLHKKQHG